MSQMGLNVNSDNLTTTYSQGPNGNPKVFCMSWVNRPSAEMADINSKQNKLADLYGKKLDGKEKVDYENEIKQHQTNAKNGGPNLAKDEFLKQANQAHQNAYKESNEKLMADGKVKASDVAKQIQGDKTGDDLANAISNVASKKPSSGISR